MAICIHKTHYHVFLSLFRVHHVYWSYWNWGCHSLLCSTNDRALGICWAFWLQILFVARLQTRCSINQIEETTTVAAAAALRIMTHPIHKQRPFVCVVAIASFDKFFLQKKIYSLCKTNNAQHILVIIIKASSSWSYVVWSPMQNVFRNPVCIYVYSIEKYLYMCLVYKPYTHSCISRWEWYP